MACINVRYNVKKYICIFSICKYCINLGKLKNIIAIIVISLKQSLPNACVWSKKKKIARDHSAWTIRNGDPKHGVSISRVSFNSTKTHFDFGRIVLVECSGFRIPHRMGIARVKQEEEETDKNNARVVRNLEERNVGTKGKNHK